MGYIVKIIPTYIPEVKIIEPQVFGDERGFFCELYQKERFFNEIKGMRPFVQDNFSYSQQGVLRGLHYQSLQPQGKLVTALRGRIFDVAVDLRLGSPTFATWVGVELSEKNHRQLWVPEGFAHGFYVLSEVAAVYYKCTDYYSPAFERSVCWDDVDLGIQWPLSGVPILSVKDAAGWSLSQCKNSELPSYAEWS
ncbi:MAG: dTDP-4-dehydrorhamnose 3,5-epimerase [Gammaproteobacteria bacterium]|jgi:dTDP-4-dehydrorhamnose 3,5-epimerase|nr:dTDP-4-dehydrorhamnose 3,5-epimerase [Gammaproteobacteria bacterium]